MSTSPTSRQITDSKAIPRRIFINDTSEIKGSYSSTPGGTLYSTTPGGTKIVYEKSTLMSLRNSPISKTPPKWDIPHNIQKGATFTKNTKIGNIKNGVSNISRGNDDNEQFSLEI